MSKDMSKRLSISIDQEDSERLERLLDSFGGSKSEIYREALKLLYELDVVGLDSSSFLDYLYLLHKRKNVSFNREIIEAMTEEMDLDQESIIKRLYDIGSFYWREYRDERYETVDDLIKILENQNWFRAIKKEEGKFTLEPVEDQLCKPFKSYLEGVFDQSPHEVQIEIARGKILLKEIQ